MADLIRMGNDGTLLVPDEPIIPFIEGDGTGVDIWPAAKLVLDAAAAKHGHRIAWKEVLASFSRRWSVRSPPKRRSRSWWPCSLFWYRNTSAATATCSLRSPAWRS